MKKLNDLIETWVNECDSYELSRSEFVKEGSNWFLRVYVDKLVDGEYLSMSTDDCELVSRYLSEKLDEADPIKQNYYLEVSSPGLDRLLVSEKDYVRFAGSEVDVKLFKAVDGLKEFSAVLVKSEDDKIYFKLDDKELVLPKKDIAKINLSIIF